jgi:hypothetical protein
MNDTNQSGQSHSATTIDPGILEMGASVSVNDEIRRSLTAETAEIENTSTKLTSDVQTEETRTTEIQKSKCHANAELSGILQCAKELVETVQMNEQFFRGLQSKLATDITQTPSPESSAAPTSVMTIQQSIVEKKEQVFNISKKVNETAVTIKNLNIERNEMIEAKKVIQSKIKSEHLKVTLANDKLKTQVGEDVLKQTQMNLHTTKASRDMIGIRIATLRDTSTAKVRYPCRAAKSNPNQ